MLGQKVDQAAGAWIDPSWWNLLIILPWAIGIVMFVGECLADLGSAKREMTASGVVTAHEPANHDRYGYIFSVNGKEFRGWQSPAKNELEIGEKVLIYYDPLNPNKNSLMEFSDLAMNSVGPVPFMLLGIGTLAWIIRTRRRKYRLGRPPVLQPPIE